MSVLLGLPGDRWPLTRAIDAVADSARVAGRSGWVWLAGIFYPSLNVSYDLLSAVLGAVERSTGLEMPMRADPHQLFFLFGPQIGWGQPSVLGMFGLALLVLPILIVLYRLIVGLARVTDPGPWNGEGNGDRHGAQDDPEGETSGRSLSLRQAWNQGKGLGAVACGMWCLLAFILLGATLILLMPLVTVVHLLELDRLNALLVGLMLPILAIILVYAIVLQVVNQLALHSLAHNRRGVVSALTHAWRLVRGSPWSAARATLGDLALFLFVVVAQTALESVLWSWVAAILTTALYGFAGVTRAGYWARTYRALGGIGAVDRVPGLSTA